MGISRVGPGSVVFAEPRASESTYDFGFCSAYDHAKDQLEQGSECIVPAAARGIPSNKRRWKCGGGAIGSRRAENNGTGGRLTCEDEGGGVEWSGVERRGVERPVCEHVLSSP